MKINPQLDATHYHIITGKIKLSGRFMKETIDANFEVIPVDNGIKINDEVFEFPPDNDAGKFIREDVTTLKAWKLMRAYGKAFHKLVVPELANVTFTIAGNQVDVLTDDTSTQPS